MEHTSQETFVGCMTTILRLGLIICDAMKLPLHERRRTVKVHIDDRDWIVETTDIPQRMITITRIE